MKVIDLLKAKSPSRDEVLKRIQNAKTTEEKRKWTLYLVKNRYAFYMTEETLMDYSDRLVNFLNIKKLGSGAYAHVFQHPTMKNVVVKVFTDKDRIYKKYLAWCQQNQSNIYVPKIIEVVPIKSETGEKYNIVFMEKMTSLSSKKFGYWLEDTFGEEAGEAYDDKDWDEIWSLMDKGIRSSKDKDFKAIWDHVKSYGKNKFDIHHGNVMMRGSQIVFSDPVGSVPKEGTRLDQ